MCWKVFEMYKPIKILSLYDNAKKSVCDLAFSILSVLILQVYNPQSQCAFVWVSPYLWVCSCIYMYANDSAFISFLNLLWSWWNNSAPTSESAQWACNEWIRSWTLNAKQIIALAAELTSQNEWAQRGRLRKQQRYGSTKSETRGFSVLSRKYCTSHPQGEWPTSSTDVTSHCGHLMSHHFNSILN